MSGMVYQWGRKAYAISPQVVGEAVESIAQADGRCTPSDLVDMARPTDSPLHPMFTWDDDVAAENWRSHEARQVINSLTVRVQVDDSEVKAPAFISVGHTIKTNDAGEGYRPIGVVLSNPDFSQEALSEAISRLSALRRRYQSIEVLAPVWRALDAVVA